jgi:hypothetical protein
MNFGSPTKLEYAKQLAAALGFVGLIRADRVRIETLNQPVSQRSPAFRGRASAWRMIQQVEAIQPAGETRLAQGVKNFCLRNPGRGVVVLISDLMDKEGYETALKYFVSHEMDCFVIQVLSQEELQPDVKGDLRLVDCEDQNEAEITVSAPLLRKYQQTLNGFVAAAQQFCSKRGLHYLLANNQVPVEELVAKHLRRRGLVR